MGLAALAVSKGAELLDTHVAGWAERIDTELLDLSDPDTCVVGQLFRDQSWSGADYIFGLESLGDDGSGYFAEEHGFDHWPMDELQRLWLDQIAERV